MTETWIETDSAGRRTVWFHATCGENQMSAELPETKPNKWGAEPPEFPPVECPWGCKGVHTLTRWTKEQHQALNAPHEVTVPLDSDGPI